MISVYKIAFPTHLPNEILEKRRHAVPAPPNLLGRGNVSKSRLSSDRSTRSTCSATADSFRSLVGSSAVSIGGMPTCSAESGFESANNERCFSDVKAVVRDHAGVVVGSSESTTGVSGRLTA